MQRLLLLSIPIFGFSAAQACEVCDDAEVGASGNRVG
jgi:hypothetical protein